MSVFRVWAMSNKWTFEIKPIRDFLSKIIPPGGSGWADPFCGKSKICEYRSDLTEGLDAHDFFKNHKDNSLDGVLFDPPYSMEQVKRSYEKVGISCWQKRGNKNGGFPKVKDEIARVVKPGGRVVSFGWNSNGMGACRGFHIAGVLLIAHGGNKHDTIMTVEVKVGERNGS